MSYYTAMRAFDRTYLQLTGDGKRLFRIRPVPKGIDTRTGKATNAESWECCELVSAPGDVLRRDETGRIVKTAAAIAMDEDEWQDARAYGMTFGLAPEWGYPEYFPRKRDAVAFVRGLVQMADAQ